MGRGKKAPRPSTHRPYLSVGGTTLFSLVARADFLAVAHRLSSHSLAAVGEEYVPQPVPTPAALLSLALALLPLSLLSLSAALHHRTILLPVLPPLLLCAACALVSLLSFPPRLRKARPNLFTAIDVAVVLLSAASSAYAILLSQIPLISTLLIMLCSSLAVAASGGGIVPHHLAHLDASPFHSRPLILASNAFSWLFYEPKQVYAAAIGATTACVAREASKAAHSIPVHLYASASLGPLSCLLCFLASIIISATTLLLCTGVFGVTLGHGQYNICLVCVYCRRLALFAFVLSWAVISFVPSYSLLFSSRLLPVFGTLLFVLASSCALFLLAAFLRYLLAHRLFCAIERGHTQHSLTAFHTLCGVTCAALLVLALHFGAIDRMAVGG
eukprot:TRINITY_DN6323_c2_g1_i1.p1 TRINITY_DN6323_c2_g1~~TRINITY_DN6323_c2_g1_i1.p1  ORF type:complete len:387 (+),score=96.75 TRINITY_DN6323_c2_g1_i1:275-1435(+)